MYLNQNLNKKFIALILMFLIVASPLTIAQTEKKEVLKEETDGLVSLTTSDEEDFFDGQITDINIIVNRYEPTTFVTNVLEEQNAPVYAYLSASPTSSFELPRIQKVTITEVTGNRSSTAAVRYYEPKTWSWDNIGKIEVRLKKIEKEKKVPDRISLDLKARIEYEADVTSNLIGGGQKKILVETPSPSLQEVIFDENADIFGGKGHIVLKQVSSNTASFLIYDSEGKLITTAQASLGRDSAPINLAPGSNSPENQVRIRLNKILDSTKTSAQITIDKLSHNLVRGTKILDWRTDEISIKNCKLVDNDLGTDEEKCKDEIKYIKLTKLSGNFGGEVYLTKGTAEEIKTKYYLNSDGIKKLINDLDLKNIDIKKEKEYRESFDRLRRDWGDFSIDEISSSEKPKAEFRIKGVVKSVQEGEEITSGIPQCETVLKENNKCKLESIRSNSVIVKHPEVVLSTGSKDIACKTTTTALYLRNLDRRYLGEETILVDDKSITDELPSNLCENRIQLENIKSGKSVEISLLSGFTRGIAETKFTLNIPIEKRLIKLSPKALDKQINSTQELIERLTKTIDKLDTVVESWTKICLATTALFTIWNFIFNDFGTSKKEEKIDPINEFKDSLERSGFTTKNVNSACSTKNGFSQLLIKLDNNNNKQLFNLPKDNKNRKEIFVKTEGAPQFYYIVDNKGDCVSADTLYIYDEESTPYLYNIETGKFESPGNLNSNQQQEVIPFIDESGKNNIIIPIKSDTQLNIPALRKQYQEWETRYGSAANSYYLLYIENEAVEVYRGIGNIDYNPKTKPKEKNDFPIARYVKGSDATGVYNEVERSFIRQIGTAQKKGQSQVDLFGQKYKLETSKIIPAGGLTCEEVLGPAQCRIMYNACDPVICPASRCNLGGLYEVNDDNIIQSGLIGSLVLCAPNFPEVAVPFCLTGILASLKNIRSYLQEYKSCLIAARVDSKSIGICDKLRSIFMCEIIWKEALTLLNANGGVLNFLFNIGPGKSNVNDFVNVKERVQGLKNTVNYFTNSYATSIGAAYRGKTTEQIGAEICRSAIGGSFPNLNELAITKPEDPPQFTAFFEEHEYSPTEGKSRYSIYYHIYAGTPRQNLNQAINYRVFLSSQGLNDFQVASSSINPGQFAGETRDPIAQRGYQKICIDLNGKVACGLKTVSSSFGINQIANKYAAENLATKITKAEQCVPTQKGTLSSVSVGYVPEVPVERVCSYTNPYLGLTKEKESEWYPVGDCGADERGRSLGRCWEHANLERFPTIQAQVYKDSCEENRNSKLCQTDEKCDGAVLNEFNIKSELPLLTRGSIGSIGIRQCCSGTCQIINPLINDEITKAVKSFDDKASIVDKTVNSIKKFGLNEQAYTEEFLKLSKDEKYKDKVHYLLALIYTKNRLYEDAFNELEKIDLKIKDEDKLKENKELLLKGLKELSIFKIKDLDLNIKDDDLNKKLEALELKDLTIQDLEIIKLIKDKVNKFIKTAKLDEATLSAKKNIEQTKKCDPKTSSTSSESREPLGEDEQVDCRKTSKLIKYTKVLQNSYLYLKYVDKVGWTYSSNNINFEEVSKASASDLTSYFYDLVYSLSSVNFYNGVSKIFRYSADRRDQVEYEYRRGLYSKASSAELLRLNSVGDLDNEEIPQLDTDELIEIKESNTIFFKYRYKDNVNMVNYDDFLYFKFKLNNNAGTWYYSTEEHNNYHEVNINPNLKIDFFNEMVKELNNKDWTGGIKLIFDKYKTILDGGIDIELAYKNDKSQRTIITKDNSYNLYQAKGTLP